MICFEPSVARGVECRKAMDAALWSSAQALMALSLAEEIGSGAMEPVPLDSLATCPLDYGAYFDLVLTPPGTGDLSEAETDVSAAYLLQRMIQPVGAERAGGEANTGLPRITNFSGAFYTPAELERLRRWWDIEPENAMGLTGVSDADFDCARQNVATVFDRLGDADPELRGEILALISDIVIAQPNGTQRLDFGAVSSFSLWGGFAINVAGQGDWPQYYRTIIHESAHNLLFGIARDGPLVAGDPGDRFYSPLREQFRPMDGIYHAAFVSARESLAFDRLLCRHEQDAILTNQEARKLTDLLEASVITYWDCVEEVERHATLTPLGQDVLAECEDYMRTNFAVEPA